MPWLMAKIHYNRWSGREVVCSILLEATGWAADAMIDGQGTLQHGQAVWRGEVVCSIWLEAISSAADAMIVIQTNRCTKKSGQASLNASYICYGHDEKVVIELNLWRV